MTEPGTRIAFLFPGQGAQYAGMGKDLCERFEAARSIFKRGNDALGFDLAKLCLEGPEEELAKTDISQPAIFLTSAAALAAMQEKLGDRQPRPGAAAGLSLGEYTALYAAGALDFETAIQLVRKRGLFMQAACDAARSGMCSVLGLSRPQIDQVCRFAEAHGVICAANFNAPGQIVISGEIKALEAASARAKELGAKRSIPLKVAGAFHSPLMRPASVHLNAELATTRFAAPAFPVVSNVSASFVSTADGAREGLAKQIVSSVMWEDSMRALREREFSRFYEIGPGKTLAGLMKKIDETATVINVGTVQELETIAC
ncbi:MAG: ACP S-malonyltransferase [Planctomycetota bacterium]|nr:ACP S-malonyltransferase [Planctomycetota bacterium]